MSTINVRDNVMQILNKAHSDAKREIYKDLSNTMKENEQLRTENDDLKGKVTRLEEKLKAHIDIRNMEKAIAIANKETVTPKKVLKDAVTDEELFVDGKLDDCSRDLYFQETSDKLYEHIGLNEKEGTIHPNRRPVLLIAKDSSGSMGIWEKYMSRCIATWTEEMLSRKYNTRVIVRYVNFHTEAKEVEKEVFFTGGDTGGTIASSAGKLLNLIAEEYNYGNGANDDIYTLFLSDGDNLTSDNERLMQAFNRLAVKCKKVWYVEPNQYKRHSTILTAFRNQERRGELTTFCHIFGERATVLTVLNQMFREGGGR